MVALTVTFMTASNGKQNPEMDLTGYLTILYIHAAEWRTHTPFKSSTGLFAEREKRETRHSMISCQHWAHNDAFHKHISILMRWFQQLS
eukprot:900553-Amphidinium_carterae.1